MPLITDLTRGLKRVYEERVALQERPLYKLLFPIYDEDTSAAFMLDKYIVTPHGVVYRAPGNQSHVLTYVPGTGQIYEVPISSEKSLVGENLRDMAVVGLEPTDSQAQHVLKIIRDMVDFHIQCHETTKIKQAIDVIRDGQFYARGVNGANIAQDINYNRAGANAVTYDFTVGGATMAIAINELWAPLKAAGCNPQQLVLLMGESWYEKFASDSTIQGKVENNAANILLMQQMAPPEVNNTKGLTHLATVRSGVLKAPLIVSTYDPGIPYTAYKGAVAAPWIPDDEALMFSLTSPRYYITRGVDIKGANGEAERAAGELVFDSYTEDDPVSTVTRSHTRHAFVPGNINHTARSIGTF